MAASLNSRFRYTVVVRVVNAAFRVVEHPHLDIRPRLIPKTHTDSSEYVPTQKDNWSRIAWRTLGDGDFWWVIADYSGVVDPFTDLLPREHVQYVCQLSAQVFQGVNATMTVDRPDRVHRGQVYRVQDLDPANLQSVDVAVAEVDRATGVITFSTPVDFPGNVGVSRSRVSLVKKADVTLTIPSLNRVLFEALDFENSENVLVY